MGWQKQLPAKNFINLIEIYPQVVRSNSQAVKIQVQAVVSSGQSKK